MRQNKCDTNVLTALNLYGGPGSVVGIATGYGLDGPEKRFSAPVQTGPGAHPASCIMGTGSFPGVKSGRGVKLTPHLLLLLWSWECRAIPLLSYRPYGLYRASVPVQGCTLPYLLCSLFYKSAGQWIFYCRWRSQNRNSYGTDSYLPTTMPTKTQPRLRILHTCLFSTMLQLKTCFPWVHLTECQK